MIKEKVKVISALRLAVFTLKNMRADNGTEINDKTQSNIGA